MKFLLPTVTFLLLSLAVNAGWTNLNTGINDHLTGVVFSGQNGVVSGYSGIYYTINGGVGAASWTEFSISGNSADSLLYEQTRFNHCFRYSTGEVFACGQDTVNNKAVIFEFTLPSMSYAVTYVGAANTSLNKIAYSYTSGDHLAVGDNGLIVRFDALGNAVVQSTILT